MSVLSKENRAERTRGSDNEALPVPHLQDNEWRRKIKFLIFPLARAGGINRGNIKNMEKKLNNIPNMEDVLIDIGLPKGIEEEFETLCLKHLEPKELAHKNFGGELKYFIKLVYKIGYEDGCQDTTDNPSF